MHRELELSQKRSTRPASCRTRSKRGHPARVELAPNETGGQRNLLGGGRRGGETRVGRCRVRRVECHPGTSSGDYHTFFSVEQGVGEDPTHWHSGGGTYMVDHVFVPSNWQILEVTIGAEDPWKTRSDHAPVVVEVSMPRAGHR